MGEITGNCNARFEPVRDALAQKLERDEPARRMGPVGGSKAANSASHLCKTASGSRPNRALHPATNRPACMRWELAAWLLLHDQLDTFTYSL